MNWILWLRIHQCSKDYSNALYIVMKNGSPEMAPRVAAPGSWPTPPFFFLFFFLHKWWLPMLEYVWPGSQGWAKEPPACGGSQKTAPGGGQQPLKQPPVNDRSFFAVMRRFQCFWRKAELLGRIFVVCGPTGVYLLDFFCSGIQFNLLLSPYPCFISLLYLDLYVLGDDALIS